MHLTGRPTDSMVNTRLTVQHITVAVTVRPHTQRAQSPTVFKLIANNLNAFHYLLYTQVLLPKLKLSIC